MSLIRKDQKIMLMVCLVVPAIFCLKNLDGAGFYSLSMSFLLFSILFLFSEIKLNISIDKYFDQALLVFSITELIFLFDKLAG